jgi:uncharacterized protein YpmB
MDQNNQPITNTSQPMTPPPVMETPHKKSGPMIAGLAIILIIIIGALYMFAARSQAPVIPTEEETTTEVQPVTNTSDSVSDLEADLNVSVDGLDAQNF